MLRLVLAVGRYWRSTVIELCTAWLTVEVGDRAGCRLTQPKKEDAT